MSGERDVDARPLSWIGLVRRRPGSFALSVLVFLVAGLVVGTLSPVTYTAQGQMIAGATSVNAAAVPSFTEAGEALAQTYARVFTGDDVQQRMRAAGIDPDAASVDAAPIPSSAVILIESKASSPDAALAATNTGIDALASTVDALLDNSRSVVSAGDRLRAAYQEQAAAAGAIDVLDEKHQDKGSATYESATARLGAAQASVSAARALLISQVGNSAQSNGVRRLTSAHITSTTALQRYEVWGALGLIAGLLVWTVIAFVRSRPRPAANLRRDG